MSTSQPQQFNEADNLRSQNLTAEASLGAGDSCAERNEGGTGTSPSNTVPNKCIENFFQPLRWGIDSLYLSYPGNLFEWVYNELRDLKTIAQGRNELSAKAQYPLSGHRFELKDKGAGLFPFILVDDAFNIRLASHKARSLPMAYAQISSNYLNHVKPSTAELHLRDLLRQLGDLQPPKVSRMDMYVDFASYVDMESLGRHAWVTKASDIQQYVQGGIFSGWMIGAGGVLVARLYNKQMEIRKSNKLYLEDLWRQAGWDGETPVWRLEFQFKREILTQLDLPGLPKVLGNLNGLWSYASTEWLKLTVPSETDQTRSRWPIHPLWGFLSSIDWENDGGPLLREYSPARAPNMRWLGQRVLGALASIAAIEGIDDFDQALNAAGDAASMVLVGQAMDIGIHHAQHFKEKVAVLNRKYNTRLNMGDDETADELIVNKYRKLSKGY